MPYLKVETLPEPGNRYHLGDIIGQGVFGKVYKAIDTEAGNRTVAIKVQTYEPDTETHIQEEYRVYRDHASHANLLDFFGVYRLRSDEKEFDDIWFVLEYCDGGSAIDFVRGLQKANRRLSEQQIAYLLREVTRGLAHLHKHHVIHRDVRASNVLLTKEGEVKLCDYSLTRDIDSTLGKRSTCIGSPNWMAPEVVTATNVDTHNVDGVYGSRADVWALGITAIEIADGVPPFANMHPTRAMFQIVRNPPPTLYRPSVWSQNFNDFIAECLEKNHEHRAFMCEILEHPFLTELPDNDFFLSQEIKVLIGDVEQIKIERQEEVTVVHRSLKYYEKQPIKMNVEDMAAIDNISEESVLGELRDRMEQGHSYSFVGDVLISLNSNEMPKDISRSIHNKYSCKSRSDNAPHVFAVADAAYQDMLHHEDPQYIVLSGESYSGKTTNMRMITKHLLIIGEGNKGMSAKVNQCVELVHGMVNAGNPVNPDSTRCALITQLTFGSTGKLSGVVFMAYLLEKMRVASTDMNFSNFHIFYYFYDYMEANGQLEKFHLDGGRSYRYLRVPEEKPVSKLPYVRDDPEGNVAHFERFHANMEALDLEADQIDTFQRTLAAILTLGNVRFKNSASGQAELENPEMAQRVAKLLNVDEKKFQWSLLNYCVISEGSAQKCCHASDDARDARDVLASTLYLRLVDWFINVINHKVAVSRAIFGDYHSITIVDMFGFECFPRNGFEQLMINSLNEQMQYHYNQRMFVWEMIETEEEQIPASKFHFYDNKTAVDQIMTKPTGLFYMIDDATRARQSYEYLTDTISSRKMPHMKRVTGHEFSIAHFTGTVTYDARELSDKNRDFLPPEMVETLRTSSDAAIKIMFTNKLSKAGKLTMAYQDEPPKKQTAAKSKWGSVLVAEKQRGKTLNTLSQGQYSQIHKMRTLCGVFRATCLELIRPLSLSCNSIGMHFIKCIRADLDYKPRGFLDDMVSQQLKALAIVDTAVARQNGYPCRISFQEFLRRYKFLAFEFDEQVDMTKDNCRLLLVRLKMEGWAIGKTKVFLKYYNEEFLSRLYETQVKKIVKVQSMMRAFLAKRNVKTKVQRLKSQQSQSQETTLEEDKAATSIQKAFRGYLVRKQYGPLVNMKTGVIDQVTAKFVRSYARRWKARSVFQVLLQYRAARYQDLVNISQQVHMFNQRVVASLVEMSKNVDIDKINARETNVALLGPRQIAVRKLPFRLNDIPYFDTSYLSDPRKPYHPDDPENEDWDAPMRRRTTTVSERLIRMDMPTSEQPLVSEPFSRDPSITSSKRKAPRPPVGVGHVTAAAGSGSGGGIDRSISSSGTFNRIAEPIYENSKCEVGQRTGTTRTHYDEHMVDFGKSERSSFTNNKKRPAPEPPRTNFVERKSSFGKKRQAPQPRSNDLVQGNGKINPIAELKMIASQRNDIPDEDDPPFNFQGMLRKTQYNRASMKRTSDGNINVVEYNRRNSYTPVEMKPPPSRSGTPIGHSASMTEFRTGQQPPPPPPSYAAPSPPSCPENFAPTEQLSVDMNLAEVSRPNTPEPEYQFDMTVTSPDPTFYTPGQPLPGIRESMHELSAMEMKPDLNRIRRSQTPSESYQEISTKISRMNFLSRMPQRPKSCMALDTKPDDDDESGSDSDNEDEELDIRMLSEVEATSMEPDSDLLAFMQTLVREDLTAEDWQAKKLSATTLNDKKALPLHLFLDTADVDIEKALGRYYKTEIAPGVILEGYKIDI